MIEEKIKSRDESEKICKQYKKRGKKIGFTSGAFDILHAGHVDYLEKAKKICDILFVGVNSDDSLKKYKGNNRPIIKEMFRIKQVAGLQSVDFVFSFNERRNYKNIETLKPHYYIKAGDYKAEELTSKKIVEKYGGEIKLIPVKENISTTSIIEQIVKITCRSPDNFVEKDKTVHIQKCFFKKSPAIFVDRDGTINEEIMYLHHPEKLKLYPDTLSGLKKFQNLGYRIVIVTNQPGIGIGYYPEEDFYRVNRRMLELFSREEILIDKIYFCPHSKSEKCSCRKPNLALIKRAENELNIDLGNSFFIGDKTSDIETGKKAGMKTILVKTGFKGEDREYHVKPDYLADNLLDAANIILKNERS
jgi:D-glycero-D-manno-heptose 1,7-bisphosphate phosphatase